MRDPNFAFKLYNKYSSSTPSSITFLYKLQIKRVISFGPQKEEDCAYKFSFKNSQYTTHYGSLNIWPTQNNYPKEEENSCG